MLKPKYNKTCASIHPLREVTIVPSIEKHCINEVIHKGSSLNGRIWQTVEVTDCFYVQVYH